MHFTEKRRRKTPGQTVSSGKATTMSGSGILVAQGASNLAPQGTTGLTPDSGATAWVLMSTCLVLFMTLPGLMLFYGKQSRSLTLFRPPSAASSQLS